MTIQKNSMKDRSEGEQMLNEVFTVVQRLNAAAGPSMIKNGSRSGNLTFNPKIVSDNDGSKHYTCLVDIYSQASSKAGTELSMEWSCANTEQFKQALTMLFPALSALAKEGYLSDTFTVGQITQDGEEIEVYKPDILKPGMISLSEVDE